MESNSGKSRVSVPNAYYKNFLRKDDNSWKSITLLLDHNNDTNGSNWEDVSPTVMRSITTLEDVEASAWVTHHPDVLRVNISQSLDGANWDFTEAGRNFESSCP